MTMLANRTRPLWIAAMIHRLSGLGLAIFLPFHFLVLGLAIRGEAQLDSFLRWTDQPLVKFSESMLVGLLAVHMLGGLRLLALENMTWRGGQAVRALGLIAVAVLVAVYFLVRVF
ncbi:MAG: succinate dehydrogenase, cytochrome b subunit [Pseudolabrys sp.]